MILSLFSLFSCGCTSMFFQPNHNRYPFVEEDGLLFKDMKVASFDGTQLSAWYFSAVENQKRLPGLVTNKVDRPQALVVQFHGNAENHTSHYRYLRWLPYAGFDFLSFSYRGYGESQGRSLPSEVLNDVIFMLRYANNLAREMKVPLIVYGQSLGGSLMLRALEENLALEQLRLILVESSFYSYRQIAREKLASVWLFWPLQWITHFLISDRLSPGGLSSEGPKLAAIPNVQKLLIYMEQDPIVPIHNGEEIFRDLKEPKEFWRLPVRGHVLGNIVDGERIQKYLLNITKR